jgi:hypothetical protein
MMGAASVSDNQAIHQTSLPSFELTGAGTAERVIPASFPRLASRSPRACAIASPPRQREPTFASHADGYVPQSVSDTVAPYVLAALAGAAVG